MRKKKANEQFEVNIIDGRAESHSNTGSTGCLEHSNHEEEGTPTARTPTANFIKMLSYRRLGKHKGKVKQNVNVSH